LKIVKINKKIMGGQNRIVVDYGDYEGLVLLGAFNTETGNEIPYLELKSLEGFDVVKKYDGVRDYSELKGKVKSNAEGFVVRFSNGERIKIKGEEYLKLHKVMTNISTTSIWEQLSEGKDIVELVSLLPDEFYKKVKQYADNMGYNFYRISEYCGKAHDYYRFGKYGDSHPEPTKKEFVEFVRENIQPVFHPVMFAIWDGKPYDKIIWNILKPEFKKL
jgi:hypothetical protein